MIATTIEQSRYLLELGLPKESADMWWTNLEWVADGGLSMMLEPTGTWRLETSLYSINRDIPAWSLSALLEVIKQARINLPYNVFSLKFFGGQGWDVDISMDNDDGHLSWDESPLNAAYEMVCWLLEQGLIKKGDNDE